MRFFNFKVFTFSLIIVSCLSCFSFASDFSDCNGHWAQDVISDFSDQGIIIGYNGNFRPDDFISRADFAVILDRIFHFSSLASNSFSDLDESKYYADSILKLNFKSIMVGNKNLVRPLDSITREEAFVMLDRAYSFSCEKPSALAFSDSDLVSEWAYESLSKMTSLDLLHGSGAKLRPKNPITRAEAVQVIYNIETFLENSNSDTNNSTDTNTNTNSNNHGSSSSHGSSGGSGGGNGGSGASGSSNSGFVIVDDPNNNDGVWEVVIED